MDTNSKSLAESIAKALGNAGRVSDGWSCSCPAHSDANPSLSVSDADNGKILVHCHAGCSQEEVISELKERGLWPVNNIEYDYLDASGVLLYQVVRSNGKKFLHRRPDGSGSWHWNMNGMQKVPYRLPELLAAIKRGESIFISEGEKDCNSLASLGLTATTNSGGAGKWSDELSDYLQDAREVIILPDNDETGRKHAKQISKSLAKINIPVKIIALPNLQEKGDVSDWLAGDGTKEKLLQLSIDGSFWTPSLNDTDSHQQNNGFLDWAKPETFGEPVLFGEIETPELTSDFLAAWLKNYVDALSKDTQTPISMATMLVLSVLAVCLQKRYEVTLDGSSYIEPLNIWTVIALPPASRKSAVLKSLMQPVIEWERDEAIRLAPRIDQITTEREIFLGRIEELKRRASKCEE